MKKQINNEIAPTSITEFRYSKNQMNVVLLFLENDSQNLCFYTDDSVQEMLHFHAEKGDIQTAVSILLVLGKRFTFPLAEKSKWVVSYIGIANSLPVYKMNLFNLIL